ncbi:diphosphomevalonate decarboxylase [Conoideocrella luteorostrata]|uniref:Diphosphomevalonate decarboxylase n=1 Tax=Conoideocrella luteorostrata TaxID=1105319 RepID=A0AAJ0FR08_9HYPO|nr:diphosphomevalonate decarboxylase [Conoideocrella luteorostrata]
MDATREVKISPDVVVDTHQKPEGIAELIKKGHDVNVAELDKSGNVQRRWLHRPHDAVIVLQSKDKPKGFFSSSFDNWKNILCDAFLPVGYPHSVSKDYLAYQTFDSLQAFFSTITSLLANRALLQGLGVGDADSSATLALLITILKDAMSRVATIIFAHRFGLRIEPDAKKYRFLADIFNDAAFFLELYSPYFGLYGKVSALAIGEALRALCGVAGGASKAALSVHFAKHDNLAELNTKEASQETAVGLFGLLVGSLVVKIVQDHRSVVYLMSALVFAHLWMNYLGVSSVCMRTLNRQRATILFQWYLMTGKVLTPEQVALRESIIFWSPVVKNKQLQPIATVEFAANYKQAASHGNTDTVDVMDGPMHTSFITSPRGYRLGKIRMLLWAGCEPRHAIAAWFQAMEDAWGMERDRVHDHKSAVTSEHRHTEDEQLWTSMALHGWNLQTQAFEIAAPIRLRVESVVDKDE